MWVIYLRELGLLPSRDLIEVHTQECKTEANPRSWLICGQRREGRETDEHVKRQLRE